MFVAWIPHFGVKHRNGAAHCYKRMRSDMPASDNIAKNFFEEMRMAAFWGNSARVMTGCG
jgi:hypothetical protein